MNKQRLGVGIAAIVGMLGTFLPWVSIPFMKTQNGTSHRGWVTLVLFLITLSMVLLRKIKSVLPRAEFYVAMSTSFFASIIAVLEIINIKSEYSKLGSFARGISIGFGLYLIILAGLVILVLGFVLKKKGNRGVLPIL